MQLDNKVLAARVTGVFRNNTKRVISLPLKFNWLFF